MLTYPYCGLRIETVACIVNAPAASNLIMVKGGGRRTLSAPERFLGGERVVLPDCNLEIQSQKNRNRGGEEKHHLFAAELERRFFSAHTSRGFDGLDTWNATWRPSG